MIKVKRIYDQPLSDDGKRILIDRLWPRGIRKEEAPMDEWLKDIAPSNELRKWFGHDPALWGEFKKKYARELRGHRDLVEKLKEEARRGTITLLYGAKDTEHNNAVALKEILDQ
jgi:uncharacterized protein YeaO (DUF488 family)